MSRMTSGTFVQEVPLGLVKPGKETKLFSVCSKYELKASNFEIFDIN